MSKLFAVIGIASILLLFVMYIGLHISFDRNVGGHLKRAAAANTVELAHRELNTALRGAERKGLTTGYTSIIYRTPDEDIGYWYDNLKQSEDELASVPPDASQLLKSNVLLKLRETILDSNGNGLYVTAPAGIARYPHNTAFAGLLIFGLLFIGIAVIVHIEE